MSQPPANQPQYPPFDRPSGPSSRDPNPFPTNSPPPEPSRFGRRLLIIGLIVMLVAPCAGVLGPREVALWYFAAAQEDRAAGHKDQAYARLADAMRWSPGSPQMLLQRAVWRLEDGQTEDALSDANQASELARESYTILSTHAQILQHLDRHAEAIQDWKAIDRLSLTRGTPGRAQALNGLAYAQAVGKLELKDALKNVGEALELEPSSPAILDTRGYILHLQGEHEKALADMDLAVTGMEHELTIIQSLPKESRQANLLYADIDLSGLNKPEQGVAVVRYHRALVLKALGRDKDAEKDLDRARELIGREPDEKLF
jgi:tetratricopeptide (TPR) repeat protein